jgi:dTDP-4-amino-4,6-dideoxygalactose transaminase
LNHIDTVIKSGRRNASTYRQQLQGIEELEFPSEACDGDHVFHQIVCRLRRGDRDDLIKFLESQGISVLVHYPEPPHLSGMYSQLFKKACAYPLTEQICGSVFSLPNYVGIPAIDVRRVSQAIGEFFTNG